MAEHLQSQQAPGGAKQADCAPAVLGSGGGAHQSAGAQGGRTSAALGGDGVEQQSREAPGGTKQADRAPAVLGSGGGAHQSAGAQGGRTSAALGGDGVEQQSRQAPGGTKQADRAPAVLGSGGPLLHTSQQEHRVAALLPPPMVAEGSSHPVTDSQQPN